MHISALSSPSGTIYAMRTVQKIWAHTHNNNNSISNKSSGIRKCYVNNNNEKITKSKSIREENDDSSQNGHILHTNREFSAEFRGIFAGVTFFYYNMLDYVRLWLHTFQRIIVNSKLFNVLLIENPLKIGIRKNLLALFAAVDIHSIIGRCIRYYRTYFHFFYSIHKLSPTEQWAK